MFNSLKNKLILLLFLLLVFSAFIGIRFFVFKSKDVYGRIKIVSSPSAGVFIDNNPVGRTPYEDKYLIGEHTIKLIPEANTSETASWNGKVKINKNSLTYVNRELGSSENTSAGEILTITKMEQKPEKADFGEIYVESEPTGTIINLDNDEKGVTPFTMQRVLKGDHEISASLHGFLDRSLKLNATGGYRVNVSFKLALDPNQEKKIASPSATPIASASASPKTTPKVSKAPGKTVIEIQATPIGYLRVRSEPVSGEEIAQAKPGETYEYIEEQSGWYKIKLSEVLEGWVSSDYAVKKEE